MHALSDQTTLEELDALLAALATSLEARANPLLILIDAWEHTPDALITWVERLLLLPLVRANKIVGALGSQVALRWRQFEVRRRVKAQPLGPFNPEFTQKQLNDNPALGRAVYEMTFGHPFANEVVFRKASAHDAPVEWLAANREEVAQDIVKELQKRVLWGVSAELSHIFSVIALFREFDVNSLRTVMPEFYPEFKNRSQSALLISIKQLLETRLVSWSDEKRAYQLDPTVRQIFSHALELSEPERYAQIRAAALHYYQQLIRDVPGSRNVYIVEYCYHYLRSAAPPAGQPPDIQSALSQFLTYYVSPDGKFVDQPSLDKLRQLMLDDRDLSAALHKRGLSEGLLVETLGTVGSAHSRR